MTEQPPERSDFNQRKERVRKLRQSVKRNQADAVQRDLDALRSCPAEALLGSTAGLALNVWQNSVAEARLVVIEELERMAEALGLPFDKAATRLAEMSLAGQLSPEVQEALKTAKMAKRKSISISKSQLLKWRQVARAGLREIAPKVPEFAHPPEELEWRKALFALILERRDMTLDGAVKELRARGHHIRYKAARVFVRRLAGRFQTPPQPSK
jgi:hypothetical protein